MDKKLEKLIAEEGVSEASILQEMASKPWKQRKSRDHFQRMPSI